MGTSGANWSLIARLLDSNETSSVGTMSGRPPDASCSLERPLARPCNLTIVQLGDEREAPNIAPFPKSHFSRAIPELQKQERANGTLHLIRPLDRSHLQSGRILDEADELAEPLSAAASREEAGRANNMQPMARDDHQ